MINMMVASVKNCSHGQRNCWRTAGNNFKNMSSQRGAADIWGVATMERLGIYGISKVSQFLF